VSESVDQPPQGLVIGELVTGLKVLKVDGCLVLLADVPGAEVDGGGVLG